MWIKRSAPVLLACFMLTACPSSHRPTYSGHEESTEGVPGFVNGKKVSPHVKLGQSYTVDGETYVPRGQPDYVEEGLASWYGPGFHGGKTANGERFDASGLTGAHRTLPLPSIVRVTLLSTGKQALVRINDRGPFSKSRIIDLSRGAAEKIGLIRVGVGKVRVEYMKEESERFAALLAEGRSPDSIDVASDVLGYKGDGASSTQEARADVRVKDDAVAQESSEAAEAEESTSAAPVAEVAANDLPAPTAKRKPQAQASPVKASEAKPVETAVASKNPAKIEHASNGDSKYYVQLGAFQKMENAKNLLAQYGKLGALKVIEKANASGQMLYHVRMGPFASADDGAKPLDKLLAAGAQARLIHE